MDNDFLNYQYQYLHVVLLFANASFAQFLGFDSARVLMVNEVQVDQRGG